jgi:hypothetical protein
MTDDEVAAVEWNSRTEVSPTPIGQLALLSFVDYNQSTKKRG